MQINILAGTAERQEVVFSQVNHKIIFQNLLRFSYLSNNYLQKQRRFEKNKLDLFTC